MASGAQTMWPLTHLLFWVSYFPFQREELVNTCTSFRDLICDAAPGEVHLRSRKDSSSLCVSAYVLIKHLLIRKHPILGP